MLDPNEKLVFDGLVGRLRDEDPTFLRRTERLARPRRNRRVTLAILLWTLAPFCIVLGGWTGLLMAVIAISYGAFLVTRRDGQVRQSAWWSSSNRL